MIASLLNRLESAREEQPAQGADRPFSYLASGYADDTQSLDLDALSAEIASADRATSRN